MDAYFTVYMYIIRYLLYCRFFRDACYCNLLLFYTVLLFYRMHYPLTAYKHSKQFTRWLWRLKYWLRKYIFTNLILYSYRDIFFYSELWLRETSWIHRRCFMFHHLLAPVRNGKIQQPRTTHFKLNMKADPSQGIQESAPQK